MDYKNSQAREIIMEWIHDELHREVMLMRLVDGLTMEKIAEKVDMSDRQIKRIVKKNERIIFTHIENPA